MRKSVVYSGEMISRSGKALFSSPVLRALHVIPSVSEKHGGPTYALHAFARALQAHNVEVVIATTDDDGGTRRLDVPLGEPVERRGVTHFFFKRDFLPYKISFGLSRWLNGNVRRFDVVHIHALFSFSSCAAARAARKGGVPYIVRPLGVLNRWGMENRRPFLKRLSLNSIELPILRGAAAIHYTSQAEHAEAVSLREEIGSLPSIIVPIPVDSPPKADAEEFFTKYPSAAGKKLILFLSRLDPKKGLEVLFEAFAAMKEAEPNSLLVVAGDGRQEYVNSVMSLAERLNVQSRILWCGHLGPDMKAAAFAAATLFVLPSFSENFGIAAAEALAAGVPTILSDQVALANDVGAHGAAVIIQPNKQMVEQALREVLADDALRQQLRVKGRSIAQELYSAKSVGLQLSEHYHEILGRFPNKSIRYDGQV